MVRPVLDEETRVRCLRHARNKRKLWTPAHLSRVLHMNLEAVYALLCDGAIPSVRINGALFVHPKPLRQWLHNMECLSSIPVPARLAFVPRVVVIPPVREIAA